MTDAAKDTVERLVTVKSPTGKENAATLRVHVFSPEQRTARVWKRLGMWWGGALGAAVIPPHIPWLTIGLLGGPIAAWLASRERATLLEQKVACPDCGALAPLERQPANWPLGARCEPCRRVFWIERLQSPQPA